ncbi:uncharacterized protein B0H18DRAFT_1126575 [Fomitopsis serialis]|uniref:uncharacterized protein n=1 Tax=Fomitopsis serialis TaxID=139415 RepID=UPI0020087802|nr:uncharacterized protein B0H18DRAFT_1126575 [Neoantrodia serialis]KAH9913106.1 hypothetical protein B0H18DRAFT_1126575 [Neoantrodia serialis]
MTSQVGDALHPTSYDYNPDIPYTSNMSASDFRPIITGATGGEPIAGALAPNRVEFRDFVKDKQQFSLYVQALEVIFKEPFDRDFSWPAIGGITQSLHAAALKIAHEYTTDKLGWVKAAQNFRVPFWDWARPVPAGEPATVKNPVHSFTFLSKFPYTTFDAPYNGWQTTLRYPTSDQPDAKSQMDLFESTYGQNNSQVRTQTYQMLTRLVTWNYFSNHTTKQNPPIANSLETIHDNMHLLIGGNEQYEGHMSDVPVAGFDAAFFLHHANVDRLLSLWQAINYDVWVTPGDQPGGTYTIKDNGPVNVQSDLTPFWLTESSFWNSTQPRGDPHGHFERVGKLYGPVRPTPLTVQPGGPEIPAGGPGPVQPGGPEKPPTGTSSGGSTSVEYNSTTHEWTVHIRFKKFELGKSYSVQVFLGETYVGSVSAFTSASAHRCENCRNNLDIELEGFVHLNEVLLQKLHTLSPDVVKPYLTKELSLKVQGRKRDLPSLKVAPFSRHVYQDSPYEVPRLGDVTYHHGVLSGKPGHTPAERW